jgi:hypothetical protein
MSEMGHSRRFLLVHATSGYPPKFTEKADAGCRRLILSCCYVVELSVSLRLLVLATFFGRPVQLVFALLLVNAVARPTL